MPRSYRIAYPGACYHIIGRGNNKQDIFRSDIDYHKFLKLIQIQHQRYGWLIHAYCLLPNHFHLVAETPQANISQIMHDLQTGYAMYFNQRYGHVGHVFQGRFKSKLVQNDAYAKELSRYIHRNPVKAGLVKRPQDYLWSSYEYYAHGSQPPQWLVRDTVWQKFHPSKHIAKRLYRQYVEEGKDDPKFVKALEKDFVLATEEFKTWVKEKFLDKDKEADEKKPEPGRPDHEDRLNRLDAAVDALLIDRGLAGNIKLFLAKELTDWPLKKLAERYARKSTQKSAAAVSMRIKRFSDKLSERKDWQKLVHQARGQALTI